MLNFDDRVWGTEFGTVLGDSAWRQCLETVYWENIRGSLGTKDGGAPIPAICPCGGRLNRSIAQFDWPFPTGASPKAEPGPRNSNGRAEDRCTVPLVRVLSG